MPRPSNTDARREQIVRGMLLVLGEVGYERSTVAAVAKAARLTPGLVHYHFANKEEILLALAVHLAGRMGGRFLARLESSGPDPRARLHAFLDAHVALDADADPAAVKAWVAIGEEAVRRPEVRRILERFLDEDARAMESLLAAALRAEGRSTRRAGPLATLLLAAIEGSYRLGLAAPAVAPAGFAGPALRRMADALIAAEPPRTPPRSPRNKGGTP